MTSKNNSENSMSDKQNRFCQEYLRDLNSTQAAIRAGYSQHTASVQGSRLLRNVKVAQEIEKLQNLRSERTKIDADYVLQELANIQKVSIADFLVIEDGQAFFDLSKATTDQLSVLSEVQVDTIGQGKDTRVNRVKIKLPDKLKTLELIGRHVAVQAWDNKSHLNVSSTPKTLRDILIEIDGKSKGLPYSSESE